MNVSIKKVKRPRTMLLREKLKKSVNDKFYICYINDKKERHFLAFENETFFLLGSYDTPKALDHVELFEVVMGIAQKDFKIQGFGQYGKSLLNEITKRGVI